MEIQMSLFPKTILTASACALLASCATTGGPARTIVGTATLLDGDGQVVGNATVGRTGNELDLALDVRGMATGLHGAHLHAVGRCEAPRFTSAGGHLNPFGRKHGTLSPDGSHLGDLPNLEVAADGSGRMQAEISATANDALQAIFDSDGTAIVVHAGPDDYRTDPSGDSGGRIACGVFARVS
jgi:Cu-Zn family superoxide dismutase